jgi:VWFA-related protein
MCAPIAPHSDWSTVYMVFSISRHNRTARHFGLALACFLLAGITVAQEPSDQAPAIKVQVQQVLVPVVVTDRKGHFITDLKASDVKVFEDGVEQKLTAFTTQQNAAPELLQLDAAPKQRAGESIAPSPSASNFRPRHTYLIVLDTLNSSLAGFVYVRQALKRLFKEEQGSDTQYAVIALGRTTLVVQNLTQDPKAVSAALEKKELSNAIASIQASDFSRQEIELRGMLEANPPTPLEVILNWANQVARERDRLTRNFLMDLRGLTEQLSRMPGRRVMIMASDGFNLEPGREFFDMIATFTRKPEYAMYNKTSPLSDEMGSIVRVATARNVTFYTLDSRGLYPPPGPDSSEKLVDLGPPSCHK